MCIRDRLRIVLCMMPQNAWLSADAPLSWGIYRNIPFALMGLIIIVLFYKSAKENNDSSFRWMWLTIVPVSYTHLDVYKRQIQILQVIIWIFGIQQERQFHRRVEE